MMGFRPTIARTVNSMQKINSTKTNATIRDLEEEEGELEEKEGVVVSIKRDYINGQGWTVKDSEGQIYVCSCASSMYEVPESVERGGVLYPKEDIKVVFTVNPVLRINTIKEIKSSEEENAKIDVSQWKHGDESTTVIAKPKSALSISDGFITMNYNNDNQVVASPEGVSTEGDKTNINTETLAINSNNIEVQGTPLEEIINDGALGVSNEYKSFDIPTLEDLGLIGDRSNNITQLHINGTPNNKEYIGEIKDQLSIPLREQKHYITDGNYTDTIIIDTDGVISIVLDPRTPTADGQKRNIDATINFITPRIQARNYIKVTVKDTCDSCDDGNNSSMEYVNYCPRCNNWGTLVNTGTSIRCSTCNSQYCQNCGTNKADTSLRLKQFWDNYVSAYGTTCQYCSNQLEAGTTKQYINYCPDCNTWGKLEQGEYSKDANVNILRCTTCESEYCSSCGINQTKHGLTLSNNPVQYADYKNALRKLKYVRDSG